MIKIFLGVNRVVKVGEHEMIRFGRMYFTRSFAYSIRRSPESYHAYDVSFWKKNISETKTFSFSTEIIISACGAYRFRDVALGIEQVLLERGIPLNQFVNATEGMVSASKVAPYISDKNHDVYNYLGKVYIVTHSNQRYPLVIRRHGHLYPGELKAALDNCLGRY